MSRYSPEGYIVKLRMLKIKTILVEGISDKKVVSRVLLALQSSGIAIAGVIIDTAEIILSGNTVVGNRGKVELLHSMARRQGIAMAALVDREFREFDLEAQIDLFPGHRVVAESLFWTRGHSIDNYFLRGDVVVSFLNLQFPEEARGTFDERVGFLVRDVLRESAVVSIAAFERSLLGRLLGVWSMSHWIAESSGLRMDDEKFKETLVSRGLDAAVISNFMQRIQELRATIQVRDEDVLRWISHGHLAFGALWTALGKALENEGIRQEVAKQVACGYADLKLRVAADFWARQIVARSIESPTELWRWAAQTS